MKLSGKPAVCPGLTGLYWIFGGASRDRTDDLIVANDALSQYFDLSMHQLTRNYVPK